MDDETEILQEQAIRLSAVLYQTDLFEEEHKINIDLFIQELIDISNAGIDGISLLALYKIAKEYPL